MWEKVNNKTQNGINLNVYRSKGSEIKDTFDLGIFFGTFESRGLVASKLIGTNKCKNSIILFFDEAKNTELRMKYDVELINQVKECTENEPIIINGISIKQVDDNINKVLSSITNECFNYNSSWIMDLGGAPIPYFLGIISMVRDLFPRPQLSIINPTGAYPETVSGYTFTSGFDKNIWVPNLWGKPDPSKPRTFIFLLGFDGHRSFDVFYSCEPEHIEAIMTSPGYEKKYEKKALEFNHKFLVESGLIVGNSKARVHKADASDPVNVWEKLEEIVQGDINSNYTFVPLGTKGHAIGCGLAAISLGYPAVLYNMPRLYKVRDVARGEYIWRYDIIL